MDDLDLKQQIQETIPPQNRVLVSILIIAVVTLFGVTLKQATGSEGKADKELIKCEKEKERLRVENDDLKYDAIKKAIEDNKRLNERIAWQDSIKNVLENIINNKKK